jgi:hypothetical protein
MRSVGAFFQRIGSADQKGFQLLHLTLLPVHLARQPGIKPAYRSSAGYSPPAVSLSLGAPLCRILLLLSLIVFVAWKTETAAQDGTNPAGLVAILHYCAAFRSSSIN